jgi:hypothetical protein
VREDIVNCSDGGTFERVKVVGVYKFECTYARKGPKVGELGPRENHFGGMTPSKCGSHSNQDQKREPDRTDFTPTDHSQDKKLQSMIP